MSTGSVVILPISWLFALLVLLELPIFFFFFSENWLFVSLLLSIVFCFLSYLVMDLACSSVWLVFLTLLCQGKGAGYGLFTARPGQSPGSPAEGAGCPFAVVWGRDTAGVEAL